MDIQLVKKWLTNLSGEAFAKHFSEKTGFIHFDESRPLVETKEFISLPYTFFYCVWLCKTHQRENIAKAIDILERLLAFQLDDGSFSTYLHQYPKLTGRSSLLDIHLALAVIIEDYKKIFTQDVFKQLAASQKRLVEFLKANEGLFQNHLKIRYDAQILKRYSMDETLTHEQLSEYVLGLQSFSVTTELEELFSQYICHHLSCYQGSDISFPVAYGKKVSSLFETVYQVLTDTIGSDELIADDTAMKLTLVKSNIFKQSLEYRDNFLLNSNINGCWALLFRSEERLNSLVYLDANALLITKVTNDHFEALLTYPQEVPEDGQKQVEYSFYLSYLGQKSLTIDGQKATIFQVGDTLTIETPKQMIQVEFENSQGDGNVIGQLSLGNRKSDITPTVDSYKSAHDWIIALRTLKRSSSFQLKMKVSYQMKANLDSLELENLKTIPSHEAHCLHKG